MCALNITTSYMNDLYYLTHLNPEPVPEDVYNDDFKIMQLTSNSLDLLLKEFSQLKCESTPDGMVYELPPPVNPLPREKPLPQPKPQTKWQKFAAEKGIKKRKHDRMVMDEVTGKMRPRMWRKRNTDPIRDAKPGVDGFAGAVDPFTREAAERRERLNKQKTNQLKNI